MRKAQLPLRPGRTPRLPLPHPEPEWEGAPTLRALSLAGTGSPGRAQPSTDPRLDGRASSLEWNPLSTKAASSLHLPGLAFRRETLSPIPKAASARVKQDAQESGALLAEAKIIQLLAFPTTDAESLGTGDKAGCGLELPVESHVGFDVGPNTLTFRSAGG